MSAPPSKRSHEDSENASGSHSHGSISKYPHDDLGAYSSGGSKLMPSVSNEYHAPYDVGQDSRMPKIARTESRDPDRRSPLVPIFGVSSSPINLHSVHPGGSESRLDIRDSRESNRDPKVEARDAKTESRGSYQGAKVDKDVLFEIGGDDNKETKHEKDTCSESKNDVKPDKDAYGGASSQLNWKDSKEQHRGKRYPDTPGRNVDPWHGSRKIVHGPAEVGKEGSNAEVKDYSEAREAVGENKIDLKGEDKFRDRDRETKEGKHRELGERDKERNDRLSSTLLGGSSSEKKDPMKEERDAERWDRERKDLSKDKGKLKDREKDYLKREAWNGAEKEGLPNEKETVDVSCREVQQENSASEKKKHIDHESWKNVDKDGRDRKKERDGEVDGERPDKRSRYNAKESDECVDAEGGTEREREAFSYGVRTEREREAFSYGVQQRKRRLRPRGSPNANRDARFRSRSLDNEGSSLLLVPDHPSGSRTIKNKLNDVLDGHSKPDGSTVIYRIGECMQELIKLWKEYESSQVNGVSGSPQNGPTLEIRIPAEHVSATNRQVRGGQLWGADIYTNDSDLVAVLMHTGFCRPTASPPPSTILELRATIRVLPPQDCYISTLRNNVRSRAWGAAIGCSYRVERCCIVKKGGGTIDLDPCLTQSSTMEPTLAPVAAERTITTRAAASNVLRQQRFVREVTIQFNLCYEPWLKYSISVVADEGLKKPLFTSSRLKKGEVLYLETHSCRYELCFEGQKIVKALAASQEHETESDKFQSDHLHSTNGERSAADGENIVIDVFRWSRCKKPLLQKFMQSIGIPLPLERVEVLEDNLEWDDIQWSQTGVRIAGKEYRLARVHLLSQN